MNEYYGAPQNDYRNYLMHYAKGQRAKNHKYIDIVNGRYIYSEDKGSRSKIDTTKSQNRVNTNYGYHVRAKQINAYLAKENGDNSVWVGGKSVGAKKESPFKKNVRNASEALTNRKAKGSLKSRAKIAIKQLKERNTNGVSDYTWYGKDEKAKNKAKKQSNRVYSPSTKQYGTLRYRGEYSSRKPR